MSHPGPGEGTPEGRTFWRALARAIVWLRFLIIPGWIALAFLASTELPSVFDASTSSIGDLVPKSSSAIAVETDAKRTFGVPLLSRTVVVAHQAGGLSHSQVERATHFVVHLDNEPPKHAQVLGALPLVNVDKLSSGGAPRTMAVYLFTRPTLTDWEQTHAAQKFADRLGSAAGISTLDVSGPLPAHVAEARISTDNMPWIELATLILVVGILAFYFRAPGIPLLGLATIAIAYICASHALGWLGKHQGVSVPQEVEPVMVALLFGVLTDYLVFFASGYRRRLQEGASSRDAAATVTSELLPVVLTAGLMIAGATLTLLLSGVRFLEVFGPGLAITVVVGVAVALTFVPAMLALMGRLLLAPGRPDPGMRSHQATPQGHLVNVASRFPAATVVVCVLVLGVAASGLSQLRLGDPVMRGLPPSSEERQGYETAASAFSPGVMGPTMLVVRQAGITDRAGALARLERELGEVPGVDAVAGPADQPIKGRYGIVLAKDRSAARYLIFPSADPESADGVDILTRLQSSMDTMLAKAKIPNADAGFAGDTAITQELTNDTSLALVRVAPAALLVLLVLVWLLLRTRAAPVYLVAASSLVVAAALGLTVYVFQVWLGYGEIAFFVPVATAILLVALGSDYNVFLIGRIWLEAERREVGAAIRTAGSRAARAIAVAGVILALSFAAIAIIPILAFREIAFAMTVGLLLDTFVARPLLIPALVALFERNNPAFGAGRRAKPAAEATSIADPHGGRAA